MQTDVDGLWVPERVLRLISLDVWPTQENANEQWDKPIYSNQDIYRPSREHPPLFFYPPPFHLVRKAVESNPDYWLGDFWTKALGEPIAAGIDPDLAIDLGDFGAGSDAAIVLDYRDSSTEPAVLGLDWGSITGKRGWTTLAESFDRFADLLGLP